MDEFPKLAEGQAALLRAESSTGIILDDNYKYSRDNQKIYVVFDNADAALKAARKIVEERKDVDCIVYGQDGTLIEYLRPINL